MRNTSDKVVEKIKRQILCPINSAKILPFMNVENNVERKQATEDNMAHAHCKLDT
jgi:hypothetical protein